MDEFYIRQSLELLGGTLYDNRDDEWLLQALRTVESKEKAKQKLATKRLKAKILHDGKVRSENQKKKAERILANKFIKRYVR